MKNEFGESEPKNALYERERRRKINDAVIGFVIGIVGTVMVTKLLGWW